MQNLEQLNGRMFTFMVEINKNNRVLIDMLNILEPGNAVEDGVKSESKIKLGLLEKIEESTDGIQQLIQENFNLIKELHDKLFYPSESKT